LTKFELVGLPKFSSSIILSVATDESEKVYISVRPANTLFALQDERFGGLCPVEWKVRNIAGMLQTWALFCKDGCHSVCEHASGMDSLFVVGLVASVRVQVGFVKLGLQCSSMNPV
jgi:hypothetical protein